MTNTYTAKLIGCPPNNNNQKNADWVVQFYLNGAAFGDPVTFTGNMSQSDITAMAQKWITLQQNVDAAAALQSQISANGPIAIVTG